MSIMGLLVITSAGARHLSDSIHHADHAAKRDVSDVLSLSTWRVQSLY